MKKPYIQPAMEATGLGTQLTLLSGSLGVYSNSTDAVVQGQVLSPGLQEWDDDDEDEDEDEEF